MSIIRQNMMTQTHRNASECRCSKEDAWWWNNFTLKHLRSLKQVLKQTACLKQFTHKKHIQDEGIANHRSHCIIFLCVVDTHVRARMYVMETYEWCDACSCVCETHSCALIWHLSCMCRDSCAGMHVNTFMWYMYMYWQYTVTLWCDAYIRSYDKNAYLISLCACMNAM